MAMALIVFLGVGLVTHQRGHIVVDVVTLGCRSGARVWLGLVTNILSLGFVLIMVWRLWLQAAFIMSQGRHDADPGTCRCGRSPIVIAMGSLFLVTGLVSACARFDRSRPPSRKVGVAEAAERPFQD